MVKALCHTADFTKSNIEGANLSGADLRCACFAKASLKNTNFNQARLDRAEFSAADCHGAVFFKAKLPYSDLSHAILSGANFTGADLKQATLHRIIDKNIIWRGANRKLAEYTDKDLAEAEDWQPPKPPR